MKEQAHMTRNTPPHRTNGGAAYLQVVDEDHREAPMSFDAIYDRFAPYVASVALHLLGDDTYIEDIVQEVFLNCFRKVDKLCSMEHARHWLVKVTVQTARRRLRKRKAAEFLHLSDPIFPEPAMPGVTADERASMVLLYSLLEQLPVNYRLAWSLRYLEGAKITEVAHACGCSLATAKRRIRRAQRVIVGADHD